MRRGEVRLVSWDLDGTLYSSTRLFRVVLHQLARSFVAGNGRAALSDIQEFLEARRDIARRRGHDAVPLGLSDLIPRHRIERLELERRWLLPALRIVGARPAAVRSIHFLRDLDIPQVVFSDLYAEEKLKAIGLRAHFEAVYAGEEIGAIKPHPQAFEQMAVRFDLAPHQILHIGDRPSTDGRAAEAAGCRFLQVGWPGGLGPASDLYRKLAQLVLLPSPIGSDSPKFADREAET